MKTRVKLGDNPQYDETIQNTFLKCILLPISHSFNTFKLIKTLLNDFLKHILQHSCSHSYANKIFVIPSSGSLQKRHVEQIKHRTMKSSTKSFAVISSRERPASLMLTDNLTHF